MPLKLPTVQTGFEKSVQEAAKKVGKSLRINMGPGAKSVEGLTRPLGRLTGKADEFTKSMEAANARVLAFGASVGVIAAVSNGLKQLVTTSIEVEKSLTNINSILKQSASQLDGFKNQIFDIARNTGQTFDTVAEAALELSRQGLKAEEVTKRLNDSLVLSRLSGLSAAESVAGLTAAVNSFSSAGLTTSDVLNKISAAAASAAVSDRDLIEGLKRSGAVAVASGVKFDELIGIISALQERTARGGAVIGNSLKTIFVRIQDIERLQTLQKLGVEVTDLGGKVLSSSKIIENLAPVFGKLDQASKVNLADNLVGKFQIAPFLALLEDFNQKISRSGEIAATSFSATNEAYERNKTLNTALAAAVNVATVNLKELANALGEIGVTENLTKIIGVFNSIVSSITGILDGDGIGSKFAKGLIKGIGAVIAGPGLALALLAIGKLLLDFAKFGAGALKTFFGLNKAAEAQKLLQGQIAASLLNDKGIRDAILSIEKQNISAGEKKKLQTAFFTKALNEQLMVMQKMQGIARTIAPGVMAGTASRRGRRAAGGFLPVGAEKSDISRGVGGAPASAKPVVIPNFAFGGGKRGTMVANSSEYIVPNYANGGDAIFNQNMASSMGLPANARKVRAASGYIPNFAQTLLQRFRNGYGDRLNRKHNRADFFTGDKPRTDEIRNVMEQHPNSREGKKLLALKNREKDKGKRSFMANQQPNKSIMLVPQRERFLMNGSDHKFLSPYKSVKNQQIDFFEGPSAGISKKLKKEKRFKILLNLDRNIEKALATGVNGIFTKFREKAGANAFKTEPNKITADNIKEQMEKGGPGALGAIKGATFEALMKAIVGGVAQDSDEGQLDIDFSKDQDDILDKIFGISGKNFKFGDFKSSRSGGNKTKFAKQVLNNVAGKVVVGRNAKTINSKTAASGYIPNFSEGALEAAIGREKAAGLPVSQIRINQSGKLRNSQNPMGLAVTNTRDEPTGAVPNFAALNPRQKFEANRGGGGNQPPPPGGGSSDILAKLFAVQMGFTGLSAMLGEVTEKNKLVAGSLAALNAVIMASMTAQAFGGFKNIGNFIMGKGGGAKAVAGAGKMFPTLSKGATTAMAKFGPRLAMLGKGLLRFAGPVGILATVGFGAMKLSDMFSGVSDSNKKNAEIVAAASKKAAEELSKIKAPEGFVEQFKTNMTSAAGQLVENALTRSDGSEVDIQGFSDKDTIPKIVAAVESSLQSGGNIASVNKQLRDMFSKENEKTFLLGGGKATPMKLINEFIEENTKEAGKVKKKMDDFKKALARGGIIANVFLEDMKKEGSALKKLGVSDISKPSENPEAEKRRTALVQQTNKLANIAGLNTNLAILALQQEINGEVEKQGKVDKVNLQVAKKKIDLQLELLTSKFKLSTEDEKALDRAKSLNTLTKVQIIDLEKTVALKKLDESFNDKMIEGLRRQTQELVGLNANNTEFANLQKLINARSKDGIIDLQDREDIGKQINNILLSDNALGKAELNLLLKTINGEEHKLKLLKKQTKEKFDQQKLNQQDKDFLDILRATGSFMGQASVNNMGLEFSKREANANIEIRDLERQKQEAGGNDRKVLSIENRIREINAKLDADREEFKTQPQFLKRAREIQLPASATQLPFIKGIKGVRNKNIDLLESQDPLEDLIDLRDKILKANDNSLPQDEKLRSFIESVSTLQKDVRINSEAVRDNTDANNRLPLTLKDLANLDRERATTLDPFSRSEAASARRLAEARENVFSKTDKSGGNVELEFRRLTMGRSLRERRKENTLTDLQINDKFLDKVEQTGATFRSNFAAAFAEGIESVDDLEDALLNAANQFLKSMTTNLVDKFMDQAMNEMSGGGGSGGGGSGGGGFMGFVKGIGSFFGFADGGKVRGGSGNRDDVPAVLTGGEFVMNKKAVQRYGSGFMEALNSGSVRGFARGGQVRDEEGMFTTPGMNGAGAIVGVENLMSFATQSPLSMDKDIISNNGAFLDPESARMTVFGRRNNPEFQKIQGAKRQAFDLALQGIAAREQAKASRVELGDMVKAAVISSVVSFGVTKALGGGGVAKVLGSGLGNFAGTKITGAPASGGAFGAAGASGELMEMFTGNKGGESKTSGNAGSSIKAPDTTNNGGYIEGMTLPQHGVMNRATGGLIPAAGGVDTVPAMLSGGEFVMNAAATKNIGAGNLQSLNSGVGAGDNTDLVSKLDELIAATETSQSTGDINITINGSNGAENQTAEDATETQKQLSEKIKVAVKQVIADEQRLGGQLRK